MFEVDLRDSSGVDARQSCLGVAVGLSRDATTEHGGIQTMSAETQDPVAEVVETIENAGGDASSARQRFRTLVDDYAVPVGEAKQSVLNATADEQDLNYSSTEREQVLVNTVDEADQWVDVEVEVVDLWEPRSDSVRQVGLVGDESGTIKFVSWDTSDLPELEEGQAYLFENVVTDMYDGKSSIKLNTNTEITALDADIEVGEAVHAVSGMAVELQSGSGLIKRCSVEDCNRVLKNGRCSEHGEVEGEFDLRAKVAIDTGVEVVNVIFNREMVEEFFETDLETERQRAMDALDTTVVEQRMANEIVGQQLTIEGESAYGYLIAQEVSGRGVGNFETENALEVETNSGESNNPTRLPAVRTSGAELNRSSVMFKESDEERAPNFMLLPTGVAANRVVTAGVLTEIEDVGNESEYLQARIVDNSGETVFAYAGQYQPEVAEFLRNAEAPEHVVLIGKPNTYETDDGEIQVSVRPEEIVAVTAEVRELVQTEVLAQTRARASQLEASIEDGSASTYAERAVAQYGIEAVENIVADVEENLFDGHLVDGVEDRQGLFELAKEWGLEPEWSGEDADSAEDLEAMLAGAFSFQS